jgi:hypothetical protein
MGTSDGPVLEEMDTVKKGVAVASLVCPRGVVLAYVY